ncbi:putative secreted protein (Por secretion system target) [Kordia periserrulae]|uniref:Putative secreted protein (Por secretion system target) n=1 Tax=Kordia periserrulae TaxID=701523 RepID=A0A2T6C090_9FLAO|nr:T9SS type A sorting domain-containing protein [Kordia periserrulae]PTX61735.1 putative secreted protein (Por secretion system target) [Kordia periserrulae]
MNISNLKYLTLSILLSCITAQAQLPLLSDQTIDFTNAVSTINSGNWSNPAIWSNGMVPSSSTHVIIENGHTVYIDIQGASSGQIVDLCENLFVKQDAVLQMGHNTANFAKDLRINGSILCNGTFSAGRNLPSGSGDGAIYSFNSRIFLNLTQATTYVSGSGYFNPKALSIASNSGEKDLIIDHYNIVIDENFAIKSNNRVNATIKEYAYLNIKNTLGLTGSTYDFSSPTAKSSLIIEGVVVAGNVSLFTKNTTLGEFTSLTIRNRGSLFPQTINQGVLNVTSEAGGFNLTLENGGLFKLWKEAYFSNLTSNNPNFTFTNNGGTLKQHYIYTTPTKAQITSRIDAYDPNLGADVSQIQDIFGFSHIAGWYNFTTRPYLLEGLDYYRNFGSTAVKTTLTSVNGRMYNAYHFNHSWPNFQNLKEVAEHEYIDSLFKRTHIKTHTFWTTPKNQSHYKNGPDFDHDKYLEQEQQYYDLTMHLLSTYGTMDKKFVYQNWEGDWMLRGEGVAWENDASLIPDDVDWSIEGMARMFRARQRGTERARNQFSSSNAKVYHAIEFNKLWKNGQTMMYYNVPSVLGDVVPKVRIDLTSWSAYDSNWTNTNNPVGHLMWKGIHIADYYTTSTGAIQSGIPVQIGEFAHNENPPYTSLTEPDIRNNYGRYIGLALDLGIQNFYLWNLYCSGQQGAPNGFTWEKDTQYDDSFLYQWMDGKWMLEPNGSMGYAATFLMEQWSALLSTSEKDFNTDTHIFPNPAKDSISITSKTVIDKVEIYNLQGKRIHTYQVELHQNINIQNLAKGMYIVRLKDIHNNFSTHKLVKK